jgi:hypothetical protein
MYILTLETTFIGLDGLYCLNTYSFRRYYLGSYTMETILQWGFRVSDARNCRSLSSLPCVP